MNIQFLFDRGHRVTEVARAAGVSVPTASKWKSGKMDPRLSSIARLHAARLLTDEDLKRAGIGLSLSPAVASIAAPAVEPHVELDPVEGHTPEAA